MDCIVREAGMGDCAVLLEYIRKLAEYEDRLDSVKITEETARRDFFGKELARALLVEADGRYAGFAVYYFSYSTFAGKPVLFLEDIYIDPDFRHRGFARAVFGRLSAIAAAAGCLRLEWDVLEWNRPAIAFYSSLGAMPRDEWKTWQLPVEGRSGSKLSGSRPS